MQDVPSVTCGPFELTEQIGEGGMGVVYRGTHERDGMPVAVKIMTSVLARQQEYKKEFRREVQAMAKLHHPAIARVVDYGMVTSEAAAQAPEEIVEGAPWFAMEFVEGDDLIDVAGNWKWVQIEQALLVLLDALAHAHANDIIHRDLKPSNIIVTDETPGQLDLKLVDFGIAHVFDSDKGEGGERAPDTWGTPEIMAPEQILGKWRDQGSWTDLYALGCVTWWMVCRDVPFSGEERSDVYLQHMSGNKSAFRPAFDVPDGLEPWLERMLAIDHDARFQRASDAAYALVRVSQMPGRHHEEDPAALRKTGEFAGDSLTSLHPVGETSSRGSSLDDEVRGDAAASPPATDSSVFDGLFQSVTPPIPDDWERAEKPRTEIPAHGTGLALFDLRKIPLVDRKIERDQLWRGLNIVHRTQQPAAVLLRGPAGSGKSRLADWIARRGHELGALRILKATHSPKGGPRDGLGPMFARHFRCSGLPWSEAFERLQDIYESLGAERSSSFHDAVGLTRMMGLEMDADSPPPGFQNPNEKHYALRRLVARLADRRPVLMWLDDVPWGWESARFAEFLLEEPFQGQLPVYILMTGRDAALDNRPQVRRMLDTIRQHEFGWDVPVNQLDRQAHRELVEQLLRLDNALVDEIVERTEGNPLFAIQLVGDWVERGILTESEQGFALRDEVDRPIPDGPHELWKRRIEQILSVLPAEERSDGLAAMQLAAALGRHVDEREWQAVCARAGIAAREELVERLVEYGLARREPDGWSFVHTMLAESLEREARQTNRWAQCHEICVEAIAELYPDRQKETSGRRAEHLIEAGHPEQALEPLLEAARRARMLGAYREHRQLLDRRLDLLNELELPLSDRRRVQNWYQRARFAMNTGRSEEARKLLERTEKHARDQGWERELGDTLRIKAQIARDDGNVQQCLDLVAEAEQCFQNSNHFLGRARCQTTKAQALVFLGNFSEARAAFRLARSIFKALDNPNDVLRSDAWITYTYIYEGEYRESRDRARQTLERARELGDKYTEGDAWNQLGECARFEREWGEARRYYQRSAEEYEQIGYRGVYIAKMNMAMVEIPAGHFKRARREFSEVEETIADVGLRSRLPHVYTGLLGAAAGLADWAEFDRLLVKIENSYAATEGVSKDTAWLAEHAARLTASRGANERARRVYTMARELWEHLGNDRRVEEIERILDGYSSRA